MALGERIKECRQKAHLSQEKVAELVGVSRQAVTKWEMNQSAPNTENLFRLAEIFGTTVDFLVSTEEDESKSLAEQIHLLYRAEEAKKAEERRLRRKQNIGTALLVLGGYLVIFLAGKLFSPPESSTFVGWLFGTDPQSHSYLFGWLISNFFFLYASLISAVPALFGKRRYALTTLAGFALSLPLGEFLGRHPAGAAYGHSHYGWAIWLFIFLLSIVMGIFLQRFRNEDISFRSKRFLIWCGVFLLGIIGAVVFVRLNMYP